MIGPSLRNFPPPTKSMLYPPTTSMGISLFLRITRRSLRVLLLGLLLRWAIGSSTEKPRTLSSLILTASACWCLLLKIHPRSASYPNVIHTKSPRLRNLGFYERCAHKSDPVIIILITFSSLTWKYLWPDRIPHSHCLYLFTNVFINYFTVQ